MARRGQPAYQPTQSDRETVKSMAASGFTHEAIARCLGTKGIDDKTMRKHFRQELDTSMTKANAAVANKVYNLAMAGNVAAMFFWLKCRARWQEVVRYEHSGPNAGPVQVDILHGETDPKVLLESRIAELRARSHSPASDTEPKPGAD